MLPETYNHLRDHGFLRGEEQVDRAALAEACAALLRERPIEAASLDEIQEKGLIVPEIRHRLLGQADNEEIEAELDSVFGPLTGPRGPVQQALENGYVLCTAQVTRKLSNNGEGTIVLKRAARFVTENHDLIERFYLLPAQERIVKSMQGFNGRWEITEARQPGIASRKQPMIAKVHEQMTLELPMGDGS